MEEHREEITLHKAAKATFDQLGVKRLPKIKALNEEYEAILAEKRALYADYKVARKQMQEYAIARKNVEPILEIDVTQKAEQRCAERRSHASAACVR